MKEQSQAGNVAAERTAACLLLLVICGLTLGGVLNLVSVKSARPIAVAAATAKRSASERAGVAPTESLLEQSRHELVDAAWLIGSLAGLWLFANDLVAKRQGTPSDACQDSNSAR